VDLEEGIRTNMETGISSLHGQIPATPLVISTVSRGQRTSSQFAATAVKEADVRPGDSPEWE